MDIVSDIRTLRLLRASRAVRLANLVPPESGKNLVALASAIREFVSANELEMAREVVTEMLGLLDGMDASPMTRMYDRLLDQVKSTVQWEGS